MQKVDKGHAWLVPRAIPLCGQFKRQGPGVRSFRVRPFPGLLALLYVRVSHTTARCKHSVQVQWVQNQIYYYVKRDVPDVSLLFGWCRYNLLIRFFLVYPRYVIDEPGSNGTVVGIFAVGFWRMCMCRFHAVIGPGRANECHV